MYLQRIRAWVWHALCSGRNVCEMWKLLIVSVVLKTGRGIAEQSSPRVLRFCQQVLSGMVHVCAKT